MKFLYWLVGVLSLVGVSGILTFLAYWNLYLFVLLVLVVMSFLLRDMFIEMGKDVIRSIKRRFRDGK